MRETDSLREGTVYFSIFEAKKLYYFIVEFFSLAAAAI